jgi:hypothetical protein
LGGVARRWIRQLLRDAARETTLRDAARLVVARGLSLDDARARMSRTEEDIAPGAHRVARIALSTGHESAFV